MATRSRYLVSYDIREDRRLRRVAQCVEGFGARLQYSVFLCDLSPIELIHLRTRLRSLVDHRVDSVMFIELGDPGRRGTYCIKFMGKHPPLPNSGGATIV